MSHSTPATPLILVSGATGNVGRHVVDGLLAAGMRVRALTRRPAAAELPVGAEVVYGDLTSLESLQGPLAGVAAVFLMCGSAPAEGVIEAIAEHAKRIVFLSSSAIQGQNTDQQPNWIGKLHADIELAIARTGVEWTFLRPGAFATNSIRWWAAQIKAGNVVRWPYGAASTAPIDERDIADLAVRALMEPGHAGRTYPITGPESLTLSEQVQTIGSVLGRELVFDEIEPDGARGQLSVTMPSMVVDLLLGVWSRAMQGPAPIEGSAKRTFREWVANHIEDFRAVNAGVMRPDIGRSDAGLAMVSEWTVDTPERQQATVDAFVAAWRNAPWPAGLVSVNLLASLDGTTILLYGQWANEGAYEEAVIEQTVPGIQRKPATAYRVYRSGTREGATIPGCIVVVSVEFDGADEQRQRQWVDTVFEALEAEPVLPQGGISGHFHVSTDGTRVINYAEWTTAEAHEAALEQSGQRAIGKGSKWLEVRNLPGVIRSDFKRYRVAQSLTEKK
ncbi:MAG: NAD(P)H-binding protein [Bryobacteraceae bacterium]